VGLKSPHLEKTPSDLCVLYSLQYIDLTDLK
jgi:hypothetical protein